MDPNESVSLLQRSDGIFREQIVPESWAGENERRYSTEEACPWKKVELQKCAH